MSLGDLGKNLNKAASNTYAQQKDRIMREAKEMQSRQQMIEADKLNKEISHLRLSKQTLEGRITQIKMDIAREKDARLRGVKETELHRLLNEKTHMEGEIITKQGREHAAHNVRYDNPHYF